VVDHRPNLGPQADAIAKLICPRLPAVYPRRRLFDRLDETRDCPCTWIAAPGGFGKTTLVAGYLESRETPWAWYQIDEGDDDVASFFYYLGLGLSQQVKGIRFPLLTAEYLGDVSAFSRLFFREAFQRLPPSFTIAFDNCEGVSAFSGLHQVLCDGIAQVPPDFRIIGISREEPPPALARLLLNRAVAVIDTDALRLTPEESWGIAQMQCGAMQTESSVRKIHDRVGGWAAALILMLEQPSPTQTTDAIPEALFHYFANEVLRHLTPEEQGFLFKTALLPSMTIEPARRLTGHLASYVVRSCIMPSDCLARVVSYSPRRAERDSGSAILAAYLMADRPGTCARQRGPAIFPGRSASGCHSVLPSVRIVVGAAAMRLGSAGAGRAA
jgi:LuxR family maltose regulon positive regulatory protein